MSNYPGCGYHQKIGDKVWVFRGLGKTAPNWRVYTCGPGEPTCFCGMHKEWLCEKCARKHGIEW